MEPKNLALFEKLKDWISKNHKAQSHLLAMEKWIKVTYPQADDALIIAAVGHDIERAFPLEDGEVKPEKKTWDDPEYLAWHGKRSARYLGSFLTNNGANEDLVKRVMSLVENHDAGGDEEKDALRDADSISFLQNNEDLFMDGLKEGKTVDQMHEKFDIMYKRIGSPENKNLADRYYTEAIHKLETL